MLRNSFSTIKLSTYILVIIFFFSCKKDTSEDRIPNVPVNFTIYLSLPQYVTLNSIGGYVTVPEYGYRGVIVYRRSLDEFVSYDLACPYDPTVTESGIAILYKSDSVLL